MNSIILNELLTKKNRGEIDEIHKKQLYEMIDEVCSNSQFEIFKEVLSDVKSEYFIDDSIHGISHNERVAVLAMFIAIKEKLSDEELRILLKAAIYHDIGRAVNEKNHGEASADLLLEHRETLAPEFDDFELDVTRFLCESHNINDKDFNSSVDEKVASKYGLQTSSSLEKMIRILKDADALDRVRLPRFGKIDVNYLRTDAAKEMVDISKNLFSEYRNTQYIMGDTSNTSIFDLDNINVIEDEENYYVFRTLNEDNIADLDNPEISVMRTKGQVAREDRGEKTRFGPDSQISIEEVYTNIRVARNGKNNNCVSFSTNANVNLDYDNQRYVMYAIPKTGDDNFYVAGKYILEEINKKISKKLIDGNVSKEVREIISQIDSETSVEAIKRLVGESFDSFSIRKDKMTYTGKIDEDSKKSLISRFNSKQFFNEEQGLEYSKIVAKLTVLETKGYLKSILTTQANNSNLLSALGGAFSSSEMIHYGDIDKSKVIPISKENLQVFALLQQLENKSGLDKESINALKKLLIENVKSGQELSKRENDIRNEIDFTPEKIIEYLTVDEELKKIIPYTKGSKSLKYIFEYAIAKKETYELIDTLREYLSQSGKINLQTEELLRQLEKDTIVPNASIISRRNNSGVKIAESVNLDMNSDLNQKMFKDEEQKEFISLLGNLTREEIERISEGDFSIVKNKEILSRSIIAKSYMGNPAEYYIDYIFDSIDFEKIYKVSNVRTEKKAELRQKLENDLRKVDVLKLYEAFINAGIDYSKVPNYTINLLLEGGYGKDSLKELVEKENLEEIIKENINNFNYTITPFSLDNYLGISNNYHVPGSSIELREYQQAASEGIDRIFETRNFAGVVLPTGAGKSFVAMAELLKNPKQNALYFAPQEGILNQVQKHILKHILGKTILSVEDIDAMLNMSDEERRTFLSTKVYNQDTNIAEELKKIKIAQTEEEKTIIKNKMLPRNNANHNDIMDAIHTVFTHLDMYCYQSLNSKEYQNLIDKKKDLIIFDELHRTGAETWRPLIKGIIESEPNVKMLGITATPNRDDENRTDMMKYMAEKYGGFTEEELYGKEYLAQEMYLTDAMQNKYVVEPNIVSFNFTLANTEQYEFVEKSLKEELAKSPDSELALELQRIKDEMDDIVYGTRKGKKKKLSEISKVLEEKIPEGLRNGRFIVFLEHNDRSSEKTSEEYMLEQIENINKYFEGVNTDVNANYLISSRKKADNMKALQEFENLTNEQLKLLYAIDMLNEGVHVENINGELMLRPIGEGSNILYFQQIGRVIFGIDPDNPPTGDEIPIIFDVYNNYLTRDLNRTANITTPTSDLNNIRLVKNWIQKYERMPDINSEKHDEARKAIILKKIQEKYEKYLEGINNDNLSLIEKKEIEKILEIAKELNLFEKEIGERIVPPGEKELGRVNAFEIKGDVKRFLELFKESKKELNKAKRNVKPSDTLRIRTTMTILQVLNEYGVEISDENMTALYRKIRNDNNLSQEDAKDNINLLDVINNTLSEKTRKSVIDELDMDAYELEDFKIYSEFDYARKSFTSTKKNIRNIFSVYDITEIRKTGILKENGKFISAIDDRGFVLSTAPELFRKMNIYTGSKFGIDEYDIDGYDIDGYNKEGYDRAGYDKLGFKKGTDENKYYFLRSGINTKTFTRWDENGFDINGEYWAPNPKYPNDYSKRINTHKKVNEYNFNRDGIWFKENENGDLIPSGKEDDRGFKAFKKVSKYNFRRDGINIETGTMYDGYGFNYDKIHKETNTKYDLHDFDIDGNHRVTQKNISPSRFDRDGFFYEYDGTWNNTYRGYDKNGRDIDGWDVNGVDKNGVEHFTQPPDERGFNQKKFNIKTGSILDENGLDYEGTFWKETYNGLVRTNSVYGSNGLTKDGINKRNFRVSDGWNVKTNSIVDENNFDIEGNFWQKNIDGELVNTGSKYDDQGYDVNGINKYGFNKNNKYVELRKRWNGEYETVELTRNPYGFDFELVHKNKTRFDDNGFDADGINKDTNLQVNKYGFNRDGEYCVKDENGEWISTKNNYNPRGFDIERKFHRLEKDGKRNGYSDGEYYDDEGYDIDGLDKHRFNNQHFYIDEHGNEHDVNPYGFGYDGFYYILNEENGEFERTSKKRDEEGYDIDNLDENGFNRQHLYVDKFGNERDVNPYGFNYKLIHKNGTGFDDKGFSYQGIHKDTNKVYDVHFFDRDGYFYRKDEITGKYIKTLQKVNDEHFDQDGYWYKETKTGKLTKTKNKYNPNGKNIDGVQGSDLLDKEKVKAEKELKRKQKELEEQKKKQEEQKKRQEKREQKEAEEQKKKQKELEKLQRHKEKFDENGICKTTNLPYDEFYFDKDGTNIITKRIVDYRGFKCTGECIRNEGKPYDRNGFKQDGTHYETGEKYYNGYNAYDVDENGKNRAGKLDWRIKLAEDYIKTNFDFKNVNARKKFINDYKSKNRLRDEERVIKELKENVFIACEMYPKLKEDLKKEISLTKRRLIAYNVKLITLSKDSKNNENEINKCKKIIDMLNTRIKGVSLDEGEK